MHGTYFGSIQERGANSGCAEVDGPLNADRDPEPNRNEDVSKLTSSSSPPTLLTPHDAKDAAIITNLSRDALLSQSLIFPTLI